MKKKILYGFVIVLFFGVIFAFVSFDKNRNRPILVGEVKNFKISNSSTPLQKESWTDVNGERVTIDNYKNKVILMNFWATWCAPCIRELPSINRLRKRINSSDFEVVAINLDRKGEQKVLELLKKLKLDSMDLYFDPRGIFAQSVGVSVIPTTIIYGRKGHEHGRLVGSAEWDSDEAVALLGYYIDIN